MIFCSLDISVDVPLTAVLMPVASVVTVSLVEWADLETDPDV